MRRNAKLRDMNISVPVTDERAIEVLASGLELNHGAQLAVDITVRSAQHAGGHVQTPVLTEARHDKEASMRSCVKVVDASLWLLALRQEDGGALRHSPSSNNWQLHVHAKPRLHCGSPHSWLAEAVVPDVVRFLQPCIRRVPCVFFGRH